MITRFHILMKYLITLMLCITILSQSTVALASTSNEYVSIKDIVAETADGWHETYTNIHGETIVVDVDIQVPDVDTFPVIRVVRPEIMNPAPIPSDAYYSFPYRINAYGRNKHAGGFQYVMQEYEGAWYDSKPNMTFGEPVIYVDEETTAENSPMTREEAILFANEKINTYADLVGNVHFDIRYVTSCSRCYKVTSMDREGSNIDWDQPVNDMGHYSIKYNQMFYDIPFLNNYPEHLGPKTSDGKYASPPAFLSDISVDVASPDNYSVSFYYCLEDSVLAEDIPLQPFSEIKKVYERLIEDGYIRSVNKIQLQYGAYYDPDYLGEKFILFPMWEVNGIMAYHNNPNGPTPSFTDHELEVRKVTGELHQYVNAQTGLWHDERIEDSKYNFVDIIKWEDVQ